MDARARGGRARHPELGLARLSDVLVVNAGSTSLKLSVVREDETSANITSFDDAPPVVAVAHRVVHGGSLFREPTLIDENVETQLRRLIELAPLHNAPAVDAIHAARAAFPDTPHVAVFDTAFHVTIPDEAATYALPPRYREEWGIRRYGFHGLAVRWVAEKVDVKRLVVCHLGGGCSVSAVLDGRSVDTTMGFTPLEGVPMVTRSGSVDPGALLHLLRHGVGVDELEHALEHESGLAGLSRTSGDLREVESAGSQDARLALDVFAYRVACAIAAMTVPLGGIDALAFSGGIGEHADDLRTRIRGRVEHLGISPERVVVVQVREDVVAARDARRVIAVSPPAS